MNEHHLRDALHQALDEVPVREVPYERISTAGRRRRTMTVTGSAAAITAVLMAGTLLLGTPRPEPLYAGAGSPAASAEPTVPHASPTPAPAVSSQHSQPPPPRPTGSPTTAGGYCPIQYPSGGGIGYVYPTALDDQLGTGTASSTPPSFAPNRAIICRYNHDGIGLAAARDLRGREAANLYQRLETTPTKTGYHGCDGRTDEIHAFFADGKGNSASYMLNASDCNLYHGLTNRNWPKELSTQLRALVPAGAGL